MLVAPGRDLRADRAAPVPRRSASASRRRRGRRRPPAASRRRAGAAARAPGSSRPAARGGSRRDDRASRARARAPRGVRALQGGRQEAGKPFFPYAMFHDTVMSLVVVSVIIGARRASGSSRAGEAHGATRAGSGRCTTRRPTPGRRASCRGPTGTSTSSSTCCGSSSGRSRSILGTVGIPTIALMLLLALPFLDCGASGGCSRRPVAIVASVLTVIAMGDAHLQGRDREGGARRREVDRRGAERGSETERLRGHREAVAGAKLFAQSGCLELPHVPRHGLLEPRRARPDGDRRDRTAASPVPDRPPEVPGCVIPASPMPSFAALGRRATSSSSRCSSRRRRAASS